MKLFTNIWFQFLLTLVVFKVLISLYYRLSFLSGDTWLDINSWLYAAGGAALCVFGLWRLDQDAKERKV
ncbi:hypothetical protein KJY78_01915 [Canibacter sp. lx-45]|uniref:hypothetical protein n=1 Tax=Canibacter zhuwentaonis TaxID=2837491 RepID=UPI001BDD7C4E|nr:hypothetical protein [Canibacter zhuwentaonis]MBT1035112.1 hypothetical protein [Canibacter zhuwentaonis]